MNNLKEVLFYGGMSLILGFIGYMVMKTNSVTYPNGATVGKWFVLALVPFIIIFGLIAIGYMLADAGIITM